MYNDPTTTSVENVLQFLSFQSLNDSKKIKEANSWLEKFQKKPEAWAISDQLLKATNENNDALLFRAHLFAAQTLKKKIRYDLHDLDRGSRLVLRDSLLGYLFLRKEPVVVTQLCVAMANLAIRLQDSEISFSSLKENIGGSPEGKTILLELLKVLPEEMDKIDDTNYDSRYDELITKNADEVLNLIVAIVVGSVLTQGETGMAFVKKNGDDFTLEENIFKCLSSWIRTGAMDVKKINGNLLELLFESLDMPDLFDAATDVILKVIYETRDTEEGDKTVDQICSHFNSLSEKLSAASDEEDDDAVRGYCGIFLEAGEAYINRIGKNPERFEILMKSILKCSGYQDLDIVRLTFKFWYELRNLLETATYEKNVPQFFTYYNNLVDIMIGHLHYPADVDAVSAEDRDMFRDFRHEMGDTLKDCCRIMTPRYCLPKPMELLQTLLKQTGTTWQQIEAPIFSLRAMGSEVPANEEEVMPHIMELLSVLPNHPKIRYAATLVISRYSFWTKAHPQFITYQLNFISSGFENEEVAAASALALKHLCKDCSTDLIGFIPQLQVFYGKVITALPFRDILEVTEAISYVVNILALEEIYNALQYFCGPVVQVLNEATSKGKDQMSEQDYTKIGDILEQISVFFSIICPQIPLNHPHPHPCVKFINELWPVLDTTLRSFGDKPTVSEPLCKCFNSFIRSYGVHSLPLLPKLMECLVNAFETTSLGEYLWVSLKLIKTYASDNGEIALPCSLFVNSLSQSMFTKMQQPKFIEDNPNAIEEYFGMIKAYLELAPQKLVENPSTIQTILQASIASLLIKERFALRAVISFQLRLVEMGRNSPLIITPLKTYGDDMRLALFNMLIDSYQQDSKEDVSALFQLLTEILPNESAQWMVTAIDNIPEERLPLNTKANFKSTWISSVMEGNWAKSKRTLNDFTTIYRRRNAN